MNLSELCNKLVETSIKVNNESLVLLKKFDEKNFDKYKAILEKRDASLPFNLFQILSHKSYHENFHSRVFKFLLEEEKCLHAFLDFLGLEKESFIFPEVVCEEKRIDILIKGEDKEKNKHAIIIENKMNYAPDQKEQLARYHKELEKEKYVVDKIVYLVPDKNKKPSMQTFAGMEDAKSKLQIIVGYDTTNKDLVTCLENVNPTEENYNFLLNHYIALLKQTGAGSMIYVAQKFTEELYKLVEQDCEAIEKVKYINEITNNNEFYISRLNSLDSFIKEVEPTIETTIEEGGYSVDFWYEDSKGSDWSISLIFEDDSALEGVEVIIYLNPKGRKGDSRYQDIFKSFKDFLQERQVVAKNSYPDYCDYNEGYIGWRIKTYKAFSEDKLAAQEAVELYNNLKQYAEEWNKK